jgi:DeoR family fructose operon transcriptional repressor
MNNVQKRKERILDLLATHETLKIDDLSRILNVSEATIRRTLNDLQRDGKVIRTHGGVRLFTKRNCDYVFEQKSSKNVEEKRAIGRGAAALLDHDESVFFDSGTTVYRAAEAVANRIRAGQLRNLKVVTHSLIVAETIGDLCEVILLGGAVRLLRMDCHGPIVEKNLYLFKADKAFVGADGLTLKDGLMTTDEYTARIAEEMIHRSAQSYLLVDHSKFHSPSFVTITGLETVDFIITDSKISPKVKSDYERRGVKFIVTPEEHEHITIQGEKKHG